MLGTLRAVRNALDADYPSINKPKKPVDPIEAATSRLMRSGRSPCNVGFAPFTIRRPWDKDEAERFNAWISENDGHPAKPIVFDMRDTGDRRRLVGQHCGDRIRVNPYSPSEKRWSILLHEIAHYRQSGHRSNFVRELVRVYYLWRTWVQQHA